MPNRKYVEVAYEMHELMGVLLRLRRLPRQMEERENRWVDRAVARLEPTIAALAWVLGEKQSTTLGARLRNRISKREMRDQMVEEEWHKSFLARQELSQRRVYFLATKDMTVGERCHITLASQSFTADIREPVCAGEMALAFWPHTNSACDIRRHEFDWPKSPT